LKGIRENTIATNRLLKASYTYDDYIFKAQSEVFEKMRKRVDNICHHGRERFLD
jgi:hypothetical protein